ncbi:MAG TPA: LAGLIDADG family homing endonuclease [Candidatus Paceibacterota bacterium]
MVVISPPHKLYTDVLINKPVSNPSVVVVQYICYAIRVCQNLGNSRRSQKRGPWSSDFAYAIGLTTADGNLSLDERHISFVSKDMQLVKDFRKALRITNKIGKKRRGGDQHRKYFYVVFGDVVFYKYLNSIGIHRAKSKTIKKVLVPNAWFADFLRGLFDGDGTFYTFRDARWPRSLGYQISFASASKVFIRWLKYRVGGLYNVKGFIRKGDGVYNLRYVKRDSGLIASAMYRKDKILFLKRKRSKIEDAFRTEAEIKEGLPR